MQALPDDSPFYILHHKWIAELVAPKFGKRIRYSAHPKMRVHLAGTSSVSDFHRDADVTGRSDQINCYLPFTDVFDSDTLWAESAYGLQDYHPINLRYGEALILGLDTRIVLNLLARCISSENSDGDLQIHISSVAY